MQKSYDILLEQLNAFISKYYKNQLLRGLIYAFTSIFICFLLLSVLEYFAHFESTYRAIIFWSFSALTIGIIIYYICIPLLKLSKLTKTLSKEEAANIIGNHFSEVEDKLLNVLQLHEQSDQKNALVEASIEQKMLQLKPINFNTAIDFSENKKYLKYSLIPIGFFLVLIFSGNSDIVKESTKRYIRYDEEFLPKAPFQFPDFKTGLETIQHQNFNLKIPMSGERLPASLYIEMKDQVRFKADQLTTSEFEYLFTNLQEDQSFRLFANGFYSDIYTLKVYPAPTILDFDLNIQYPKYTKLKPKTIQNIGDVSIPEGSELKWTFKTSQVSDLEFIFLDEIAKSNLENENQFSLTARPTESMPYFIHPTNKFVPKSDSLAYYIEINPDMPPGIRVEEQADSLNAKRLFFSGVINDDYGFKKLEFFRKKDGDIKAIKENITIKRDQNTQAFFHYMDLSELKISAGEEFSYYFIVWDNDGINGSKSTRSQNFYFKAPTLEEIAEKVEETNEAMKSSMEENIEMAQQLQKELDELNKKLLDKEELSWEDKKQVKELIKKQQELQENVQNLEKQNAEKNKEQSEYQELSEEILQKQALLEKLFEELMTDEMKELFEELEEMMENLDKDKLQEKLEEIKLSNEDLEKELDRNLELLKQFEFEQKLDENIKKMEELAEKQESLSEESNDKETDKEELKEKQDELNEEFSELQEEMEKMEKMNEELEDSNKLSDMEKLEEETSSDMKESSEQLEKNKKNKASKSQKAASEKMEKMAMQMKMDMQAMSNDKAAEDMEALRQILENLVDLSIHQEAIMDTLSVTDPQGPKYVDMIHQQNLLKDDANLIADSLYALSKRQAQIAPSINREMSSINFNFEKALSHMAERQSNDATFRNQNIMTSANNLALLLNEILDQMQQQMANSMPGNQSCEKPGGNGQATSGKMKNIKKQMEKQLEQMRESLKKGSQSGGEKMGEGKAKELAKMAAKQEAMRQQLEEMARQMQEGENGDSAGNKGLKEAIRKMEENEEDIVNNRINKETLKRQEEIMVRLLEVENAEREQEKEKKRESQQATQEKREQPSEFLEYQKQKLKQAELLQSIPPSLRPFYKEKVNEYFQTGQP